MDLGVEVYPKMPRKKSKAVPEGSDPVLQDTSELLSGITPEEIRQIMSGALDKHFDIFYGLKPENPQEMRAIDQRLVGLDHDARQPSLTTEADVPPDKKTHKRAEDAAADQAKHEDSSSAKKVDAGPPMCLTSFSDDSTEPLVLPCRDDAMVYNGAAAPKSCLLLVEMHTPTAADGLLPAGTASTAMRTIFSRPLSSCTLGEEAKERTSRQTTTSLPLPAEGRIFT